MLDKRINAELFRRYKTKACALRSEEEGRRGACCATAADLGYDTEGRSWRSRARANIIDGMGKKEEEA